MINTRDVRYWKPDQHGNIADAYISENGEKRWEKSKRRLKNKKKGDEISTPTYIFIDMYISDWLLMIRGTMLLPINMNIGIPENIYTKIKIL